MKIKTLDKTYEPTREPVMLMFFNDEERLLVAQQLMDMPMKPGVRKYAIFPDTATQKEKIEFMQIHQGDTPDEIYPNPK